MPLIMLLGHNLLKTRSSDAKAKKFLIIQEQMAGNSIYILLIFIRVDQLRVLDAVIELFETRFVELNDYINSQVRMEGDDDIVRHDATENSPEEGP